jgi:hypothetical protein
MKITIDVETDNSAFGDTPYDMAAEVQRIIEEVMENLYAKMEVTIETGKAQHLFVSDYNGNTCGKIKINP